MTIPAQLSSPLDTSHYPSYLSLMYQVVQSISGKPSIDPRWPDCQELAAKLFFHASTIHWLRQGTRAPLPGTNAQASFFDLTSVSVLARACLDTFLTLFHVFFSPASEDEFEFRYVLWKLAGEVVREGPAPSDASLQESHDLAQQDIADLRARIKATALYKSLTAKQQRAVLAGARSVNWSRTAEEAGFGKQMIRQIRAFYSGHVHADGLSASQVLGAETRDAQIEHIEIDMTTVMIVLAKFICLYADKFPEARAVCLSNADNYERCIMLAGAASSVP